MDETPRRLPADTTPTWELELLVSGASVFSLVQLPDRLDGLFVDWLNASPDAVAPFIIPLGIYLQFSVLVLAITFVVHLFLRGYWVALVGLDSVYPGGVRWDRLNIGRHYQQVSQKAFGSMAAVIEAADNRATRVFAVGFGMAMAMLLPILLVSLVIALLYLAQWLHLDGHAVSNGFWALVVLAMVPFFLAVVIDRRFGERLAPESRAGRWLARTFALYARFGMSRISNPLISLYMSQLDVRRAGALIGVVMGVAMLLVAGRMSGSLFDWNGSTYAGLPSETAESAENLRPGHYDSLRGEDRTMRPLPYIEDPVASGPYLRLFIPYRPRVHNPALSERCPEALTQDGAGREQALSCLARLQPIAVDGVPISEPWLAASDPRTGRRGMLVMIPVRSLADGRHVVSVMPAPRVEKDGETRKPFLIPFWK